MDQQNNPNAQKAQPVENQAMPPEIHTFLDNILTDANMPNLDQVTREEMIKELFARLDQFIASTIVSKLTGEDVETFIKMNEEKKPQDEIQLFLMQKIPDAQQVMT